MVRDLLAWSDVAGEHELCLVAHADVRGLHLQLQVGVTLRLEHAQLQCGLLVLQIYLKCLSKKKRKDKTIYKTSLEACSVTPTIFYQICFL